MRDKMENFLIEFYHYCHIFRIFRKVHTMIYTHLEDYLHITDISKIFQNHFHKNWRN